MQKIQQIKIVKTFKKQKRGFFHNGYYLTVNNKIIFISLN